MGVLLLVGLDEPEVDEIRRRVGSGRSILAFENLPRIQVVRGELRVEHPHAMNHFVAVERVVYHAIFEDDFDFLAALALWGGPCLPGARGMMDLRQRLPGLVRALAVSRFGQNPRGYADRGSALSVDDGVGLVAKWGNWHCGEDKVRVDGRFTADQPTLLEPYIEGEAVRIVLVGDRAWQVRMAGDGWLKSIHHPGATFMPIDPDLRDDARRLVDAFGLETVGVDYMVAAADGSRHLLEVNHVPNVTVFPEVRAAYLDRVVAWTGSA